MFSRYEQALMSNDVATLNALFRDDARTIRYGGAEKLYGHAEISAFRAARSPIGLARTLSRTVITSYGRDCAVASTLFHREPGKVGRQMQTWVRFPRAGALSPPMSARSMSSAPRRPCASPQRLPRERFVLYARLGPFRSFLTEA